MSVKKAIEKVFEAGVLIKSIFGIFEILVGILLSISTKIITDNFIIDLAQQEIANDPNDLLASFIIKEANNFSNQGAQLFASLYLIIHGFINLFLVIALLKNKVWAYHFAITAFAIFIIYQLYRYFYSHSIMLFLLTIFDIFIVVMIWLEYQKKAKHEKSIF